MKRADLDEGVGSTRASPGAKVLFDSNQQDQLAYASGAREYACRAGNEPMVKLPLKVKRRMPLKVKISGSAAKPESARLQRFARLCVCHVAVHFRPLRMPHSDFTHSPCRPSSPGVSESRQDRQAAWRASWPRRRIVAMAITQETGETRSPCDASIGHHGYRRMQSRSTMVIGRPRPGGGVKATD